MATLWQMEEKIVSFLVLLRKVCLEENRIYKVIKTCITMACECVFFKQKLKGLHCGIRQREQMWRGNITLFSSSQRYDHVDC